MQKIAITGGGTGGHLVIAKALKEAACSLGLEVVYIGSTQGQDRSWFEKDEDFKARFFLETQGIVNKRGLKKILALWDILKAFFKARKILKEEKIEAVVSVGGYSAAAASFAALSLKLPFYIHEQNAVTGKLNGILKSKATAFFSSYEEPVAPYPVRDIFFQSAHLRDEIKTIIFLGGSQGAQAINDLALSLAPKLADRGIKIIHQCGTAHLERVSQSYKALSIEAEVFAFSEDLPALIAQADMAIARSGASTVWELTANLLPALFIPYPYAAQDHQAANAKSQVDHHAAWMMREGEIDEAEILKIIDRGVKSQSKAMQSMLEPKGAQTMIQRIIDA